MLQFLPQSHKFFVDAPVTLRQAIEFGPTRFFTTLIPGLPIAQIDAAIVAGGSLFANPLGSSALFFHAEAIMFRPKEGSPQFPELELTGNFDFGFVQGIKDSDLHLDFWGRFKTHGRTVIHIDGPNRFQVDTHPLTQPFTRIPGARFKLKNVTEAASKFVFLQILADFSDHPMFAFRHTVSHATFGVPNLLRSVSFKREFRTIFCFRDKKSGDFTPISSTAWQIKYDHVVNYTGNGTSQNVTGDRGAFPSGGSPGNIEAIDRQILASAKSGGPFQTPATIDARMDSACPCRQVTTEDSNADFDPSFFA